MYRPRDTSADNTVEAQPQFGNSVPELEFNECNEIGIDYSV